MAQDSFEAYFGTNYIPNEAEIAEIKEILRAPIARISTIDEEIAATESKLRELQQEKDAIGHSIAEYRALVSPVRHLPTDVLREIFVECLPEGRCPTMSNDEAPMLLTRISSQWRTVAMDTPRLWASIHIPAPTSPDLERLIRVTMKRAHAIEQWLNRSGGHPLTIIFYEGEQSQMNGISEILFRPISQFASRLQHLSLLLFQETFFSCLWLPASRELPMLKTLCVQVRPDHFNNNNRQEIGRIIAPQLTTLSLSRFAAFPFDVAWSQITHLTFWLDVWDHVVSLLDVKHTLAQFVNLVSCVLKLYGPPNVADTAAIFSSVIGPHLKELRIKINMYAPNFVKSFNFSNLRVFEFDLDAQPISLLGSFLLDVLSKTDGNLHELSIAGTDLGPQTLLDCLRLCPSLKTFNVGPCTVHEGATYFYEELLRSLAPMNPNGLQEGLCPKLDTFKCRGQIDLSDETLLEFILRKQSTLDSTISKLRCVELTFSRLPTIDIPSNMSTHLSLGLKVDLKYRPAYVGYEDFSLYRGLR